MSMTKGSIGAALCAFVACAGAALAHDSEPVSGIQEQGHFASDLVIVRFDGTTTEEARQTLADTVGEIVRVDSNDEYVVHLRVTDVEGAIDELTSSDLVTVAATPENFIAFELNLSDFALNMIDAPLHAGESFDLAIEHEGMSHSLMLDPWSIRGTGFNLRVQNEDGSISIIDAPAPRTVRGTVAGHGDVVAVGSVLHDGLSLAINFQDEGWFVQPISDLVEGVSRDLHVVYTDSDTIGTDHECGGALEHNGVEEVGASQPGQRAGNLNCEIAYDADVEFYNRNGGSVNNTIADIENVQAGVTAIYERDCGVTFTITDILVRTSEPDPYTSTDPGTLLDQFRAEWNANQGSVHRDLAHLMTGKNINGGVIGIAWLSVVCNQNLGYGLSESRFTSNFNSRLALTAHEIGHNFSANHCSGGSCHIMCAGLGGCGGIGLPNFGTSSANIIANYAASRNCMEKGGGNEAPSVIITAPTDGAMFEQGVTVNFAAIAQDPEDGNVANALIWSSNIDGPIGIGGSFGTSALSQGSHIVTATVTDSGGESGFDTVNVIITGATTKPAKPTQFQVNEAPQGNVSMTWNDNSDNEDGFTLRRTEYVAGAWTNLTDIDRPANSESYNDNVGEGVWRYRMHAYNAAGFDGWTVIKRARPATVTNPDATVDSGTVTFTWNDASDFETYYEVKRQQRIGGVWTNDSFFNVSQDGESFEDNPGSGTFRYRVRGRNPVANGNHSPYQRVTVP